MATIARRWRAIATPDGAAAYVRYFEETLQPELATLPGFLGALLLRADDDDQTRLEVITQWASMDAIHGFAGDDISAAVVEPEARTCLRSWDTRVEHSAIALDTRKR